MSTDLAAHVVAGGGIEGGEGLIEQQQLGTGNECPGQGHPLGLPAGQSPGPPPGQANALEPGGGEAAGLAPVVPTRPQPEGDVVEGTEVGEQQVVLEHHTTERRSGGR